MSKTRVIAIANQKGGVGKTTTTANLGYALADSGKKVLLIDFDPQTSLTQYLNIPIDQEYYEIGHLLMKVIEILVRDTDLENSEFTDSKLKKMSFEKLLNKCIVKPTYKVTVRDKDENGKFFLVSKDMPFHENLDIIPTSLVLSDVERRIASENIPMPGMLLYKAIEQINLYRDYDYILIDCNPSLAILTTNAIAAATSGVIVPTNLDLMSTRGVVNLIQFVTQIQTNMIIAYKGNVNHLGIDGVVLNLFRAGRSVDEKMQDDLTRYYPFVIYSSRIPESINAKKAVMGGLIYSQVYKKAETAYAKLAKEIEEKLEESEKTGPQIRWMEKDKFYTVEDVLTLNSYGYKENHILILLMGGWTLNDVEAALDYGFSPLDIIMAASLELSPDWVKHEINEGKSADAIHTLIDTMYNTEDVAEDDDGEED